jgi:hypothetical protein
MCSNFPFQSVLFKEEEDKSKIAFAIIDGTNCTSNNTPINLSSDWNTCIRKIPETTERVLSKSRVMVSNDIYITMYSPKRVSVDEM